MKGDQASCNDALCVSNKTIFTFTFNSTVEIRRIAEVCPEPIANNATCSGCSGVRGDGMLMHLLFLLLAITLPANCQSGYARLKIPLF